MRWGTQLVLGVLVMGLLVPVAGASTPPKDACAACGYGFEFAAGVSVEQSTVLVSLNRDGSASWTVRNEVGHEDARALRDHPNLTAMAVEAVRSRGLPGYRDPVEGIHSAENVSAVVVDDTVVIRFDHPGAATRINDVLLLQYFRESRWGITINAKNFTVVGPPGTTITTERAVRLDEPRVRTTVDERRLTWSTESSVHRTVYRRFFVGFAAASDPLAGAKTTVAIGRAVAPTVIDAFFTFVFFQTALFAAGVFATIASVRRTTWAQPGSNTKILLGAIGAVGLIGLITSLATRFTGSIHAVLLASVIVALYGTIGLMAWSDPTRSRLERPRGQALAALLATAATVILAAVLQSLVTATNPTAWWSVRVAVTIIPIAAFFPLGGTTASRDRRHARRWGVVAVVAFALAIGLWVNLADPPGGIGAGMLLFVLFPIAIGMAVVGVPLALIGRYVAEGT